MPVLIFLKSNSFFIITPTHDMLIYDLSLKQNCVVLGSQIATFIEFQLCVRFFVARKDMVLWPLSLWNFQSESSSTS